MSSLVSAEDQRQFDEVGPGQAFRLVRATGTVLAGVLVSRSEWCTFRVPQQRIAQFGGAMECLRSTRTPDRPKLPVLAAIGGASSSCRTSRSLDSGTIDLCNVLGRGRQAHTISSKTLRTAHAGRPSSPESLAIVFARRDKEKPYVQYVCTRVHYLTPGRRLRGANLPDHSVQYCE